MNNKKENLCCSLRCAVAGLFRSFAQPLAKFLVCKSRWLTFYWLLLGPRCDGVSMCRADYISQCNAADWRKRRRPAPRRDTVETADGKILLLYVIAILTSLFFVTKLALGL